MDLPLVVVTRPIDLPAFTAHCAIECVCVVLSFPAVQCFRGTFALTYVKLNIKILKIENQINSKTKRVKQKLLKIILTPMVPYRALTPFK